MFRKLVRDRIPELSPGPGAAFVRARPTDMAALLLAKVREEAAEAASSGGSIEELADLAEAFEALCAVLGHSPEDLQAARAAKRQARGGFCARWVLEQAPAPNAHPPQPTMHGQRLALAERVLQRARARCGDDLLAAGIYGSTARDADGPYSDLEMLCVVRSAGVDDTAEWAHGRFKAEVNFVAEDAVLRDAAAVDGRWPLTHGAFVRVLALHDPSGFFARLRAAATGAPRAAFTRAIAGLLIGEVYEAVGKIRNASVAGHVAALPALAVQLTEHTAHVLGLEHRHLYSTGSAVLEEALALAERPQGFDDLCASVLAGDLCDPALVFAQTEALWAGLVAWARVRGYPLWSPEAIPF